MYCDLYDCVYSKISDEICKAYITNIFHTDFDDYIDFQILNVGDFVMFSNQQSRRRIENQKQSSKYENSAGDKYCYRYQSDTSLSYVDAREMFQNENSSGHRSSSYRNDDERSRHSDSKTRTRRSRSGDEDVPDQRSRRYSRSRSSSRSRSRSRDRSYRSRSSSRRRSRSRSPRRYDDGDSPSSRSGGRRRYKRGNSRSRSPSYDRDREPRPYPGRREKIPPNSTLLARGLPPYCDEAMLYEEMGKHGFVPKDIRVVKCRETGQSRGFGFVEFVDVDEAIRWMLYTQGRFQLDEQSVVDMEYSFNKSGPGQATSAAVINYYASAQRNGDWTCAKCNTNNFKKRDTCFKCNIRHDESDALNGDGFGEIGVMPCDTLLLRNLPLSADEHYIMACVSKLTSLDLRRIVVARNEETKQSRCFAYLEMNNLTEAAQLLTTLTAVTKLNIDGKEILVSYSKHTLGAVLSGASLLDDNQQSLPLSSSSRIASGSSSMPTDVTNAAAAVAQNAIKKAQVLRQVAASHIANSAGVSTAAAVIASPAAAVFGTQPILMVNPAAAAAAAMLLQQQRQQQSVLAAQAFHEMTTARLLQDAPSSLNLGTVMTPYGELPKYPTPNVSLYQYESSSGFYYDPSTGLYYDGKSQYYYNSETQQYLYWDASYQTYIPAQSHSSTDAASNVAAPPAAAPVATQSETPNAKKAPKGKEDKVKTAKQIQKDMERWAKQNAKSGKKGGANVAVGQQAASVNADVSTQPAEKPKGAADAAFSVLAKTPALHMSQSGLVSYDAPDSDDDSNDPAIIASRALTASSSAATDASSSSPDVDFEKMACLLCRRQFPSKEVLLKHQQFSDLHKLNLDAKNRSRTEQSNSEGGQSSSSYAGFSMQYRDRAKERRQKFGDDDRPMTNKLKERYLESLGNEPAEQPTASGIGAENIGNKLLKTMGWQEGQGLGRKNQGITDPIKQQRRVQGAGLGAGGVLNENGYALSYKEQVLQTMRQKYYEST